MLRRVLLALLLSPLMACADSGTPDTAATATPAPVTAPAAEPAAPATVAPASPATGAPAELASTPPTPAPAAPAGDPPRPGIDYEVLEVPQPTWGRGKIEVAEVFGYPCIHCANLQPLVDAWHKTLPADVRFEYVPAVFGGVWDSFARAYFAAEALGVREKTHNAVFDAYHVQRTLKGESNEHVADLYEGFGVDRAKFLSALTSFGVNSKVSKARLFATRTGITATPTMIVNGKYMVKATPDRGFPGMLATVDYLVALERSGAQAPGAP
jgi:thiol:disulfide interchange protein DsbA